MTIVKREGLGRPMTWGELDGNFDAVEALRTEAAQAVAQSGANANASAASAGVAESARDDALNAAAQVENDLLRVIKAPEGEVLGELPVTGDRNDTLLGFGSNGQPIVYPVARFDETNVSELWARSLGEAGYEFLGFYENGPFTFANKKSAIVYDGNAYTLSESTDVGFITTGVTSVTFDVDKFSLVTMVGNVLRKELGFIIKRFATLHDMTLDSEIITGDTVETTGFYSPDDGGGAVYVVKSQAVADGVTTHTLVSGLFAEMVTSGDVSPLAFGVKGDGTDTLLGNHHHMQMALNAGITSFDFGDSTKSYVFNKCFGLPDRSLYIGRAYKFKANGAVIKIESPTAMLTSKTVADNNGVGSGGNTFSGKVFISGFSFWGTAESGLFDGDYLYNVYVTDNDFTGLKVISKSFQAKPGEPLGYFQSVFIKDNIFISCGRILSGKRGFNITFKDNMCEGCGSGLYIDGDGQPALTNIRIVDNLFEGGGLFCSFGDAIGGIIRGNYFEGNTVGDVPSKKCHIDLSYKGGSSILGWDISDNTFQDRPSQIADDEFQDISFNGVSDSAYFGRVIMDSNWTSSRLTNKSPVANVRGNTQGRRVNLMNLPSTSQEARIDYLSRAVNRPVASNLNGTDFTVLEMDILNGNPANRDLVLDVNLLMRGLTSGRIVTCTAAASIKILISATGSGVISSSRPQHQSVSATLVSYIEQPSGVTIDEVLGVKGTSLFTNPVIRVEIDESKVRIIFSNYSAKTVTSYGLVVDMQTYITASAFVFANNPYSAAKWTLFV